MKLKWMAQTALCVVAAGSLAGCMTPVQVKNVEQDRSGYLTRNFSPSDLPASVQKTISDADADQLNFKQVTYHVAWAMNVEDKNKTTNIDETHTMTNVGGTLIESMAESSRNGEPMVQLYELSYRNILSLKSQTMNVSANLAPMSFEVKDLQHFDPVSSLKSGLNYQYKTGTSMQIMNFRDGRTTCVRGDAQPASDVNPSLSGEAWEVICTNYNMNGVQQNKNRLVYFMKYGFAILMHSENAGGINDGKLVSITVQ
jgi:hypothetical protein